MPNEAEVALMDEILKTEAEKHAKQLEKLKAKMPVVLDTLTKLREAGVTDKTATSYWDFDCGVFIDVDDPENWGKIHSIVGKLVLNNKYPIGDGRSKKIRVTMQPADERYENFYFQFVKKLSPKDKCKVVTTTRRSTTVVCQS